MCFALPDRMPPERRLASTRPSCESPLTPTPPCVNALPETNSKEGLSSGGLTSMLRLADAAERPDGFASRISK